MKPDQGKVFIVPFYDSGLFPGQERVIQEAAGERSLTDLFTQFKSRVGHHWPSEVDLEYAYAAHNIAGTIFYGGLLALQEAVAGCDPQDWWRGFQAARMSDPGVKVYEEFQEVFREIGVDSLIVTGAGACLQSVRDWPELSGPDLYREIRQYNLVHIGKFKEFQQIYAEIGSYIEDEVRIFKVLLERFHGAQAAEEFDKAVATYVQDSHVKLAAQAQADFDVAEATGEVLSTEEGAGSHRQASLMNLSAMAMGVFCLIPDDRIAEYLRNYRVFLEDQARRWGATLPVKIR